MNIRPFDWRDLPVLHRYREQCLFFDSALVLTRGPIFAPAGALLSSLAPATGIFTLIAFPPAQADRLHSLAPLIGQVTHATGLSSARLSFLAPQYAVSLPMLNGLLEHIIVEVGERGALHLVGEVDVQEPLFELLRQAGFGVYARQRVWKLLPSNQTLTADGALAGLRRAVASRDAAAVRFLYANLVPGMVQQVEPPPAHRLSGLVFYRGVELLAYVELRYGPRGIWAHPFVHPDAEGVAHPLFCLLQNLPRRDTRPVYVCIRSYQAWLEPVIEALDAQPGPNQAVVVRHLALSRRALALNPLAALNGKVASEPSLPVPR